MYARGIGNPYGYNYPRDANGNIEFTPAPWGGANSVNNLQPVAYNSTAANVAQFDSIENYMIKTFAAATGSYNEAKVLPATWRLTLITLAALITIKPALSLIPPIFRT
jgi:hypothetical protein